MANNADVSDCCFRSKVRAELWLKKQNFYEIRTNVWRVKNDRWTTGEQVATIHFFRGRWEISFHEQ